MKRLRILSLLLAFAVTGAALSGCANRYDLEPAQAANQVAGLSDAAVSTVQNVRVVAQADEWPGDVAITREVTPVRVVMENNGNEAVRVQYSEFALVGPDGARYAALPPYRIEGDVSEPTTVYDTPVANPAFTYTGFSVAPYYSGVYPSVSPYAGDFYYDPYYYNTYSTYWANIDLPTEDMLDRVLPEGVLDPGGRVEGYVYFEKVDAERNRVNFTADVTSAADGDILGRISIPFTVEE